VQYTFLFTEICLRQVHDIPATRLIERHAPDFFPGHRRNSLVMGRFVAGEIGVARVSGQGQRLAAAADFARIARSARVRPPNHAAERLEGGVRAPDGAQRMIAHVPEVDGPGRSPWPASTTPHMGSGDVKTGRQSHRDLLVMVRCEEEKPMEFAIWIWILAAPAVAFVAMSRMK
jgi:hypothetical protein